MSREHKCDDLLRRNIQYEHIIMIERHTTKEWNIKRLIFEAVTGNTREKHVLRDIKYCPFCAEELIKQCKHINKKIIKTYCHICAEESDKYCRLMDVDYCMECKELIKQ